MEIDHLGVFTGGVVTQVISHRCGLIKQGQLYEKQGNSVARDLPRTGSETNTTIFVIYILDIDSHCPYLLSGKTTFQLTSC